MLWDLEIILAENSLSLGCQLDFSYFKVLLGCLIKFLVVFQTIPVDDFIQQDLANIQYVRQQHIYSFIHK